jgi:hypothetical protein
MIIGGSYCMYLLNARKWKKALSNSSDVSAYVEKDIIREHTLKVHKHEIFLNTFFAETETIWSQGPVTRDF